MSKTATGKERLKIFGIGFMRTGSSSMTRALRELGYEIIHPPRPALLPELLEEITNTDGANYSPIAYQYKELDKIFPNTKWILTTRSLETWLKSVEFFLKTAYDSGDDDEIRTLLYGHKKFDKEKYTEAFFKHHKEVYEYFKDRDLLVMNIYEGGFNWENLCSFLGIKEIPKRPFPHDHTTDNVREWWDK